MKKVWKKACSLALTVAVLSSYSLTANALGEETKKYETHLSSILSPGTKLSIIMVSNIIFSETTEGSGFEVSDWTETEETITLPPLS